MRDTGPSDYLASPRHGWFFANDRGAQRKIAERVHELRQTGRIVGKTPIVNIQDRPSIIELHDGNATAVAWLIHARQQGIPERFEHFARCVERIVILRNRVHESGETWHPFVPADVGCREQLEHVVDAEQGRTTCKARTTGGEPVYFDDTGYFADRDAALPLGQVADTLAAVLPSVS